MTDWTPGEVPPPDETTAPWWAATQEHRLLVQHCTGCGHVQHPPRALCVGCGSMDHLTWVEATGAGTVDACTTVHRAPRPGVPVPYTVARVRLAEGPLLVTRLEPESGWAPGDAAHLGWTDLPDGRALPTFHRSPQEP